MWVPGENRENDYNFYQYLGKNLVILSSLGQWEELSIWQSEQHF